MKSYIITAFATTATLAASHAAGDKGTSEKEKCYGIAKAGKMTVQAPINPTNVPTTRRRTTIRMSGLMPKKASAKKWVVHQQPLLLNGFEGGNFPLMRRTETTFFHSGEASSADFCTQDKSPQQFSRTGGCGSFLSNGQLHGRTNNPPPVLGQKPVARNRIYCHWDCNSPNGFAYPVM